MSWYVLLGARSLAFLIILCYPSVLHIETALEMTPNKRLAGQKTGRF